MCEDSGWRVSGGWPSARTVGLLEDCSSCGMWYAVAAVMFDDPLGSVPPVERAARAYDCWLRVVQQHRPGFDAAGCGLTESERADVALLERLLLPSLFEEAGFAYMRDVVAAVNGYRHVCRVL